ncbi:C-, partial [Paramuricea clavata]
YQYGENGWLWPSATIVLSIGKITSTTKENPFNWARSNAMGRHAEERFLDELETEISKHHEVTKIEAKLVQNYSPCSVCAHALIEFKKKMQNKNIDFSLTIKFANFYRHTLAPNKEGLMNLLRNDVKLELLQGKDEWEAFLNYENIELTNDQYTKLLEMATSEERTNRETNDVKILSVIEFEAIAV